MQATGFANGPERPTDWQRINWRAANRRVRNLRHRIFRATQSGDWARVRSLQKLMLRSRANTLVSVRRVTQVNQGKHTAGVDKVVVKTPAARGRLVDQLMTCQPWTAAPAKRVYIPKATGKKVKDVQATRARAQAAPVADNLPATMPSDAPVGTTIQEGRAQEVADYLPHVPVIARSPSAPADIARTAAQTTDTDMTIAGNDDSRVTRRPPGRTQVAAADTQTGQLFDAGGGYADLDQLLAALWADLEALGG